MVTTETPETLAVPVQILVLTPALTTVLILVWTPVQTSAEQILARQILTCMDMAMGAITPKPKVATTNLFTLHRDTMLCMDLLLPHQ